MNILIIFGMVVLFAILFSGAFWIMFKVNNKVEEKSITWSVILYFLLGFILMPVAFGLPICLGIYLVTGY